MKAVHACVSKIWRWQGEPRVSGAAVTLDKHLTEVTATLPLPGEPGRAAGRGG